MVYFLRNSSFLLIFIFVVLIYTDCGWDFSSATATVKRSHRRPVGHFCDCSLGNKCTMEINLQIINGLSVLITSYFAYICTSGMSACVCKSSKHLWKIYSFRICSMEFAASRWDLLMAAGNVDHQFVANRSSWRSSSSLNYYCFLQLFV